MKEIDCDESDRNLSRSANARSRPGETRSSNLITSKDTDGDRALPQAVHRTGASCRTKRADTATDVSAFLGSEFFKRKSVSDASGSNKFNSGLPNRHGRTLEWLHDVEIQMSSHSFHSSSNWRLPCHGVANVANGLPPPKTRPLFSSGGINTRSSVPKVPHSEQFTVHRHFPSAVCKLPCQSCGNSHAGMMQDNRLPPSPKQDRESVSAPVRFYKRNHRLSRSARHPEMGIDVTPAPVRGNKLLSAVAHPPFSLYHPKLDQSSISAKHPEMAADVVLANRDSNKIFCNSSQRNIADMDRNYRHTRSASVGIPKSENRSRRAEHNSSLSLESNWNLKHHMPRMLPRASSREQRRTVKNTLGSNTRFSSPNTNDSGTKSPAAVVQQWFSQLLWKGHKTRPQVDPLKAGKPPCQPRTNDSVSIGRRSTSQGDRSMGVSCNKPEELMGGATLGDLLNTKGVIFTETKVISKASGETDQRSSVIHNNVQGAFPTMHLCRSRSAHSDGLFQRYPMQYEDSLGSATLDRKNIKQQWKAKERLLSPPKRRKDATSRLEMLVQNNECYNLNNGNSANSQPPLSRRQQFESIVQKLPDEVKVREYEVDELNEFLRKQRKYITQEKPVNSQVMVILSGHGYSSLSSMVSTICCAWILESTSPRSPHWAVYVPIINIRRRDMWRNEQAAWLFHQCGVDGKALLFSDEVDLEKLAHTERCKTMVFGRDIFRNNGEVASCCTLLVEKHSQDAQSMLKGGIMKKLLLAGLLLDTENMDFSAVFCTVRDEAAASLLLPGAGPNGRYGFYLQLKRQYYDREFRSVLREMYGENGNCYIREAISAEEESEAHEGEGKTQKRAMSSIHKIMKETRRRGMSASSSITDSSSEPLTTTTTTTIVDDDDTSSSPSSSRLSSSSDTTTTQVFSTSPVAGKTMEGDKAPKGTPPAEPKVTKRIHSVSRLFQSFTKSIPFQVSILGV